MIALFKVNRNYKVWDKHRLLKVTADIASTSMNKNLHPKSSRYCVLLKVELTREDQALPAQMGRGLSLDGPG